MNKAPLQLKHYFITDIFVKAYHNYKLKQSQIYNIKNLQSDIKYRRHKTDKGKWQVQLKLRYTSQEEENMPYEFSVNIVGFFEIVSTLAESKIKVLVRYNAPAMLYSAACEIIATVSGRGPWGPFFIPTVSFIPKKISRSKKTKSSKK